MHIARIYATKERNPSPNFEVKLVKHLMGGVSMLIDKYFTHCNVFILTY